MNIEKLAKHLKEFTLDEIEMIAECDCKIEIERLLNCNKILVKDGVYKYVERNDLIKFGIFIDNDYTKNCKGFEKGTKLFLLEYVAKHCSKKTYRNYKATITFDILPCITKCSICVFDIQSIISIYELLLDRGFKPLRIKNTMALLKQILVFCKKNGYINNFANFQVKRITSRNEFDINRIIFED